ncbi:MAG: hypothetical protein NTV21_06550 [Planctomycetota bacterium]|nr:hypothetical protein [Planctomycetota bacterium]
MDAKLLNKLKFHLARLAQEETEDDWQKVVELCDSLLEQAPDARTRAFAKRLASVAPALRDWTLPADFAVLQRELDAATRKGAAPAAAPTSPEEQVAALLKGRAMVVIGGDRRPEHQERLREAFGLSEVLWADTREQNPDVTALESCVARADVAVVVLMIRWIRHALGEVATLCERHDKPLVRLTAGYNPAQVAVAILEQTGKRLGGL